MCCCAEQPAAHHERQPPLAGRIVKQSCLHAQVPASNPHRVKVFGHVMVDHLNFLMDSSSLPREWMPEALPCREWMPEALPCSGSSDADLALNQPSLFCVKKATLVFRRELA